MKYRSTYFRIRAEGYIIDPARGTDWASNSTKETFIAESRALFQSQGWTLHPGREIGGVCDTVSKGKQELYLHPMNFSGVIREDEIQALKALMEKARTFRCYHVDLYEEYLDVSDEEYLELLESRKDEITDVILKYCQSRRSNRYLTGPVASDIAVRTAPKRVGDQGYSNKTAINFMGGLIGQLVEKGLLVTADTAQGPGIRTATEKEQRAHRLEESGPAGNMMIQGW